MFMSEEEYSEHPDAHMMDETIYADNKQMMILRYWPNEYGLSEAWEHAKYFMYKMSKSS